MIKPTLEQAKNMDLNARKKWAQGSRENALLIWNDALSQLNAAADVEALPTEISILCNKGHALAEMQNFGEALATVKKALEKAYSCFDYKPELAAFANFTLSSIFYAQKDFAAAQTSTIRAKYIWEKAGNREKAATCMNNLGRINEELGNLQEGIYWHEQAVAQRRLLPDKADLAFSLGNLGVALATTGQWEKAESSLCEALDIYKSLGMAESREYKGYNYNLEICRKAQKQAN